MIRNRLSCLNWVLNKNICLPFVIFDCVIDDDDDGGFSTFSDLKSASIESVGLAKEMTSY